MSTPHPTAIKVLDRDWVAQSPRSRFELFWVFSVLALQGFGGVMPILQRELVEKKRWLSVTQFAEEWAVAQIMPGPNVVNLSLMLGGRYFGWSGAVAALIGMLLAPTVILLVLTVMFSSISDMPRVQGAMRGLGAVSAGMIAATSLKLLPALRHHILGKWGSALLAISTFVCVAWLHWPLVAVLLSLGSLGIILTYRGYTQLERAKSADSDSLSSSQIK